MLGRAGPGPGAYMLPPTVGYENHDPSRFRNPQFSIGGKRRGIAFGSGNPGPQYNVDKLTRFGKSYPPAFTMAPRWKDITSYRTPGPGTYSPELAPRMKEIRPPAYTMGARTYMHKIGSGPGPNQYNLPSALGPKIPDLPAAAAYSISGRHGRWYGGSASPGPAMYGGTDIDKYKPAPPKYTMAGRFGPAASDSLGPGPAAYLPGMIPGKDGPKYSFGMKHADSVAPYISAEDNVPCT